jgi:hypothetical protein
MMEVTYSSEMSVLARPTRRHISEDGILRGVTCYVNLDAGNDFVFMPVVFNTSSLNLILLKEFLIAVAVYSNLSTAKQEGKKTRHHITVKQCDVCLHLPHAEACCANESLVCGGKLRG